MPGRNAISTAAPIARSASSHLALLPPGTAGSASGSATSRVQPTAVEVAQRVQRWRLPSSFRSASPALVAAHIVDLRTWAGRKEQRAARRQQYAAHGEPNPPLRCTGTHLPLLLCSPDPVPLPLLVNLLRLLLLNIFLCACVFFACHLPFLLPWSTTPRSLPHLRLPPCTGYDEPLLTSVVFVRKAASFSMQSS